MSDLKDCMHGVVFAGIVGLILVIAIITIPSSSPFQYRIACSDGFVTEWLPNPPVSKEGYIIGRDENGLAKFILYPKRKHIICVTDCLREDGTDCGGF